MCCRCIVSALIWWIVLWYFDADVLEFLSFHFIVSLFQYQGSCLLGSRGTVRSSRDSSSHISWLFGKTSKTGKDSRFFMCYRVNVNIVNPYCAFYCVWPQCTKGSDALPGEPCEGLPAEWAGGSVIQDDAAERPADRVWGHGSETQRGCWYAQGDRFITKKANVMQSYILSSNYNILLLFVKTKKYLMNYEKPQLFSMLYYGNIRDIGGFSVLWNYCCTDCSVHTANMRHEKWINLGDDFSNLFSIKIPLLTAVNQTCDSLVWVDGNCISQYDPNAVWWRH